jgi:hypothetical protein
MADINKKTCLIDNDCEENYYCAFDEKDLKHYCISNDVNDMYYGCMEQSKIGNFESVQSNSNLENKNIKTCIDFSRKQLNSDGLEYNYMIYKPKKNVYLDTTTLNIYLKCDDQVLATIPYNDYFTLKCNETQDRCILQANDSLENFIKQNSKNCNKTTYLEVVYSCENENIKKSFKVDIDLNNYIKVNIPLICPIEENNDKYLSKCASLYINNEDNDSNPSIIHPSINKSKSLYDCPNPVYKLPRIVSDTNKYKKKQLKKNTMEIKDYDDKIIEKLNELKRLKAEKYIKLKYIQTGETINFEDALNIINKMSVTKLLNTTKENWQFFNNMDAIENIINNDKYNSIIEYYGQVYTIEDAIKISNENNQNMFVWYHNSYELENYASKLYFIDIYGLDNEILNKDNWSKHDNVTTGLFKFQIEHFDNNDDASENTLSDCDIEQIKNILIDSLNNSDKINKYIRLQKNILDDNGLSKNVINKLDDQITTFGQAIEMNNYETTINNRILMVLGPLTFLFFVIFISVMVYFNNLTAGKIKIMGK